MKVLHIISSGGMYGAEAVILNLSRLLNEGGHRSEVAVFCNSTNPNLQLHERALREGIQSHLIPCTGQVDRAALKAVRELAASSGTDVVHAHGFKADVYAYLALRRADVPLVSTCHTWYDTDWLVTLYGRIDRMVLRRFARVVAVSDEVRQQLLAAGVSEERVRMVRNGIDMRPFENVAPALRVEMETGDTPIVGLIGRLARSKGVDLYLDAAARVLSNGATARFVVIGAGPDRSMLERKIDEMNLRGRATMLGQRDDMPAVYASLDIMVSASRQEGLPMAILEGMASGLPLVATAVGEVPAVVEDGRTGLLVPPEDAGALATGIAELLNDPAGRARMGTAGRERVREEYSAERMAGDYLRVYDEAKSSMRKPAGG
ncbi:MAG TPA: glycosyltransferase family 4 protein [Acidobacteriaceae bacterium]